MCVMCKIKKKCIFLPKKLYLFKKILFLIFKLKLNFVKRIVCRNSKLKKNLKII